MSQDKPFLYLYERYRSCIHPELCPHGRWMRLTCASYFPCGGVRPYACAGLTGTPWGRGFVVFLSCFWRGIYSSASC